MIASEPTDKERDAIAADVTAMRVRIAMRVAQILDIPSIDAADELVVAVMDAMRLEGLIILASGPMPKQQAES